MKKILIVCKGNICRSPLAQGLLTVKSNKAQLPWVVDSAGTGHWHIGKLPDSRSISEAQSHGLDITDQRARQFSADDFGRFDQIYVMDKKNRSKVLDMAPNATEKSKVELIMNELYPGQDLDVPDPFHNGKEQFSEVYRALDEVTDHIISKYQSVQVN